MAVQDSLVQQAFCRVGTAMSSFDQFLKNL